MWCPVNALLNKYICPNHSGVKKGKEAWEEKNEMQNEKSLKRHDKK